MLPNVWPVVMAYLLQKERLQGLFAVAAQRQRAGRHRRCRTWPPHCRCGTATQDRRIEQPGRVQPGLGRHAEAEANYRHSLPFLESLRIGLIIAIWPVCRIRGYTARTHPKERDHRD
jgi:hypothetical protein